jgi:hypothetical protein
MTYTQAPSPEDILASGDPGDETANRYRFQWVWAAIVCCSLLDETVDVAEVFCEHHEDVLLKHKDGSFTGQQVKTRGNDQPQWKAGDEAVLKSCARFADLDAKFVGQFRCFSFLTNHQFYSSGNGQDLTHILELIKEADTFDELPKAALLWIKKVAKHTPDGKFTDEIGVVIFDAMSKTVAKADLPKLRDAEMRLIDTIAQCWPQAEECSHGAIKKSSQELIEECCRASSLGHLQLLPAYLIATEDVSSDVKMRIDGKRMKADKIESIFERGRDSIALMEGDPSKFVSPGEGSTNLMHQKLGAGGFSIVSRNSADDLRDKADYLGLMWTNKFGSSKGLAQFDHIRSIALNDAGKAFDATQTEDDSFGPKMREDLHRRFEDRRKNGEELFDTTNDHLEGVAFSLTSQCKIAWSHARPWENDDESS